VTDEPTSFGETDGKLPVFISWSLPLAGQVAVIIRDWLKRLITDCHPWASNKDIEKGKFWHSKLISSLDMSTVGIVIVTPVNVDRPWLNFEAGALARTIEPLDGVVMPLLINIGNAAIQHSPLDKLQVTQFEKGDFFGLVDAIHSRVRSKDSPEILREEYEDKWPKLKQAVDAAIEAAEKEDPANAQPEPPPVNEALEDVVVAMRELRQEVKRVRTEATPGDRQNLIYRDVMKMIMKHSDIDVHELNIIEGRAGAIYVNIWTASSVEDDELERITEILESVKRYYVLWSKKPFYPLTEERIVNNRELVTGLEEHEPIVGDFLQR
jgi:hypothetical protein